MSTFMGHPVFIFTYGVVKNYSRSKHKKNTCRNPMHFVLAFVVQATRPH